MQRADEGAGLPSEVPFAEVFHSVLDGADRTVVMTDDGGRVRYWNRGAVEFFGVAAEEAIGQDVGRLIVGAEPQWDAGAALNRIAPGSSSSDLWVVKDRFRKLVPVIGATSAVRRADGQLVRVLELWWRGVTALHWSRDLFEQVSTPLALTGLDARFLAVNRAWCDLLGRTAEDLLGTDAAALIHPMDAAADRLAPLRAGTVSSASYEFVTKRADGQLLPLLLEASVLRDGGGTPYAVAVFARDVTEIREARHRLGAQESFYRALGRRASDAACVTDAEFNVTYVSPAVTEIFGHRPEELLTTVAWDFVHPDDRRRIAPVVNDLLAEPDRSERFSVRAKDAGGRWRWVEVTMTNCLADPDIGGLVTNLRDITAEVHTEQALRESEARYRAIVETAQEGIAATAPDGTALFVNEELAQLLGVPLEQAYRLDILQALRNDTDTAPSGGPGGGRKAVLQEYEVTYCRPDGTVLILCVTQSRLYTDELVFLGHLSMVSDVTAARRVEEQLRHQALHDPLTALPNRYLLADRLAMASARRDRGDGAGIAVLFLDLDQFKTVNDTRGHETGDLLLKQVAQRVADSVRAADTVARLGGDEFAVICEEVDEATAKMVASRIQQALRVPVELNGDCFLVGASIGIALSPPHNNADLLRLADAAMYQAKAAGGGTTVVAPA